MTTTLISSQNTRSAERKIRKAARSHFKRRYFETVYEHGQWWVLFDTADEQFTYSVCDASGSRSTDGFYFEQV
jgi:hypothetical protein